MNPIMSFVKSNSLVAFFVLAYAFSWSLMPLIFVSPMFGVLGLFGPALAAITVTAVTEGKPGVRALLSRLGHWRVAPGWYGMVLVLPTLVALVVLGAHLLLGGSFTFQFGDVAVVSFVLAILVVGEEIGWRGYALPRMQARFGSLSAAVLLGVLWAAWHLVNVLIPGLEYYGYEFPAFLIYVVSLSVLFAWIANGTGGSLLVAWLFHASVNLSGAIFSIGDQARYLWLGGIAFGVTALIVVLLTGRDLSRNRAAQAAMIVTPAESTVVESAGTL